MSDYVSVTDVAKMMAASNENKIKKIVFRASNLMRVVLPLEHQCRRAAVMKRGKTCFMNQMQSTMIGIQFDVANAVSDFFESVLDYDAETVENQEEMAKIWDSMAI